MCTNSNEQSMFIRFLWTNPTCAAPPKVAKVSKATVAVTGNYAWSFASNFAKVKTLHNGPWLQNTMVGKGRDLLLLQETVTVVFSLKNLSNWPQHSQVNPATQMANATKRTNWAECYKTFYGRNLRVLVISPSVCPWKAFPAQEGRNWKEFHSGRLQPFD